MGKIIAIANQKGGVGKTTTAINLASGLGLLQKKVLLIDSDPQGNASQALGLSATDIKKSTLDLLENTYKSSECISNFQETHYIDVIPTKINLASFETKPNSSFFIGKLKWALKDLKHNYDFIIIDCCPNLGLILLNILHASDSILIPVQCEYFAYDGLKKILRTFKSIKSNHNPNLDIEGILLTMYNDRQKMDKDVKNQVQSYFKDLVFNTIIHRNVRLTEAPSHKKSIYDYDNDSTGAINYLNLANEIILKNVNNVSEDKNTLGKSLASILKEDYVNDIEFIVNLSSSDNNKKDSGDVNLKGFTKNNVKEKLGLVYNDIHSNVWMYRINDRFNILKKNYLYIYFKDSKVIHTELKWLKMNKEKMDLALEKYTKSDNNIF